MIGKLFRRYIVLFAFVAPGWVNAALFTNLYVLGDSLSDQGNLLIATSSLGGPALPDPVHYFAGRFSNGPVYTDVLAQRLGLPLTPSLTGGNNFAFGGARTTYNVVELPPASLPVGRFPWSLNAEVAAFNSRGIQDPGALYIVFSGSNDIADILSLRLNPATVIPTTLGGILSAIQAFKNAGAQTILVPNLPDLGLTPAFRGGPGAAAATNLSAQYNALLHAALQGITDVDIIEFDTFSFLRNVVANPAAFGLSNVTTPCYSGFVTPNPTATECSNPDQFLFWDIVHPTRVVHALLGNTLFGTVVPTPGTLPLVLISLLALAGLKLHWRPA